MLTVLCHPIYPPCSQCCAPSPSLTSQVQLLHRELEMNLALSPHANVVRVLGACAVAGAPALVMELMLGGSLYGLLHRPRGGSPSTVKVAVLVAPYPATTGSSGCTRKFEAVLRSREERPSIFDFTERPRPLRHRPPKTPFSLRFDHAGSTTVGRESARRWDARALALEVAEGLNHLHMHGIVHRDVKSPNVLLTADRHAAISDFGLATRFGMERSAGIGTCSMVNVAVLARP